MELWRDDLTLTPDYLRENRSFVAEGEQGIAGVCVLEVHGEAARLEHVWVEPARQRQGVGKLLVTEALGEAKRMGIGTIELVADPHAEAFYRRLGAVQVREVPAPMPGAEGRTLPLLVFRI